LKKRRLERLRTADADRIIDEITVDANGEDEQLWALRQAFDDVAVPCAGSVLGHPVTVSKFDYDGNERRDLTANCHRSDGREYIVSLSDVCFLRTPRQPLRPPQLNRAGKVSAAPGGTAIPAESTFTAKR
jgi:hypothetical protein